VFKLDPDQTDPLHRQVSFGSRFFLSPILFNSYSSLYSDAVIPLTYGGCGNNKDGLCSYDTVLQALIKRIDEIDFDYDCNGNCKLISSSWEDLPFQSVMLDVELGALEL